MVDASATGSGLVWVRSAWRARRSTTIGSLVPRHLAPASSPPTFRARTRAGARRPAPLRVSRGTMPPPGRTLTPPPAVQLALQQTKACRNAASGRILFNAVAAEL